MHLRDHIRNFNLAFLRAAVARKERGLYLLALFSVSLLVIAFDYHQTALTASDCPVCKAKGSLGHGISYDLVLDAYIPFACCYYTQQPSFAVCAVFFSPLSRSPPA